MVTSTFSYLHLCHVNLLDGPPLAHGSPCYSTHSHFNFLLAEEVVDPVELALF